MAVAVFDYTAWSTLYPEFGAVSEQRAALLFGQAGLFLDNTDCSIVQDVNQRTQLLYMLTAHLAALGGGLEPGGTPSGAVGRVTKATEGSTSVEMSTGLAPGTGAWFGLTNYGLMYWQATKAYRNATYIPAPSYAFEPVRGLGWRR